MEKMTMTNAQAALLAAAEASETGINQMSYVRWIKQVAEQFKTWLDEQDKV